MKKQMMIFAVLCVAAVANAQTTITVDKALGTPSETKKLNDAVYKGANGLAFIGDARQTKEEGKEQGLTHEEVTKYFKADGKTIKATAAVNFQKAPVGIKNKQNNIIPTKAPHNRAVEFKPASNGKLFALVWSKNPSARLFYAVVNNGIYDLKEFKMWEKGSTAGTESNPYEAVELDYNYKEGDVVYFFATGPLYMSGVYYTGAADTAFEGASTKDLVNSKKMAKLAKQKKAAAETSE